MRCYDFTLVLDVDHVSEADADRLYGECDDATIWTSELISRVGFSREAPSLEQAMKSAVADVGRAGFKVRRIELDSPEYCSTPG
ncbi:MAG: hypothetical protein WD847_13105 [Pirellulales bacterium]|jgi:hypothetical protein